MSQNNGNALVTLLMFWVYILLTSLYNKKKTKGRENNYLNKDDDDNSLCHTTPSSSVLITIMSIISALTDMTITTTMPTKKNLTSHLRNRSFIRILFYCEIIIISMNT